MLGVKIAAAVIAMSLFIFGGMVLGFELASENSFTDSSVNFFQENLPLQQRIDNEAGFFPLPTARKSPKDRISENDIRISSRGVSINVDNAIIAKFTDTKSMEPVLFKGANAIEIIPESEEDIQVGDIISYTSDYAEGIFIHRVIEIGKDEKGTYFITKGDNEPLNDPDKKYFDQVQRVLVGILY